LVPNDSISDVNTPGSLSMVHQSSLDILLFWSLGGWMVWMGAGGE
jgi:hypothetical protein